MDNLQSDTVIFLHIPKTAGTTLHRILNRQYQPDSIHSFGSDAHASIEAFKAMDVNEIAQIQLLRGHMPFGLHEYIPHSSTYITLLRDPIERVISKYYFLLRSPEHYLYDRVTSENWSLRDLLESKIALLFENGQTRMLSGVWGDVEFGMCNAAHLEMAKKNLREHFSLIGFTERFDETLLLLQSVLDWQGNIYYSRANVTPKRPRQQEIDQATLDLIAEVNQQDIALYAYAERLFEEKIAEMGWTFRLSVQKFRWLQWYLPKYRKVRGFSVRMYLRSVFSS